MSHTLRDCMQVINIMNFDSQESNRACQILGVDCSIDSSLADLSTNIAAIDVDDHPMIELPWVMADGSSGFLMPVTMNKNRNVEVTAALVPAEDDARYLAGFSRVSGGIAGLNQMTAGMRGRLRLEVPPGTSADTNNYAGINTQWTSSFPYYQPMKYAVSKYDQSSYRCSMFNGNTWTHAGSGMAQASTSTFNNYVGGILAIPRINADNIAFPWDGHNAPKGTILYSAMLSTGTYDSSSNKATYLPYLCWDSNFKKYRPVLYDSTSKNMSSFALDNYVDTGNDCMYYIDKSIGLTPAGTGDVPSDSVIIQTDIYNNPNYTFFIRFNTYKYNGNVTILYTDKGAASTSINFSTWDAGSSHYTYLYYNEDANTRVKVINNTVSSERVNTSLSWCMKTNSSNVSRQNIGVNTSTSFWTKYNYSCAKNSLSDRGNFKLIYDSNTFTYWFFVLDENGKMIHYLVPCMYNGSFVAYDVITKRIYS